MTQADRSAVVQRRRKSPGDSSASESWHDWRTYESAGVALAAIVIDMREARVYEYRLKPDPFAIAPTIRKKDADTLD